MPLTVTRIQEDVFLFLLYLPEPEIGQNLCHFITLRIRFPEWYGTSRNSSRIKRYERFSRLRKNRLRGTKIEVVGLTRANYIYI